MSGFVEGELPVFDIDEIADHLLEQGISTPPSELHGCLCGLLAAGGAAEAEAGLAELNRALDLDVHGELAERLMQLYTVTALSLQDDEFDFFPLLPDDSCELDQRTAALAAWCRGFIAGYARAVASAGRQRESVAADSSEILRDLAVIAQADVDPEADPEESESSYAELVEYIRIAALNAYLDTGLSGAAGQVVEPGERQLH